MAELDSDIIPSPTVDPAPHAPWRMIAQVAATATGIVALCDDNSMWIGSFTLHTEGGAFVWRMLPPIPVDTLPTQVI
jgi:hypothetical protein